jgi:glycosyltransferase involved in cell wall biosynthesis
MNILINCPSKFDISSNKLGTVGGIESLNVALARKLVKLKFNVILSTFCSKKIKINKLTNIPINKIIENKKNYRFDLIISSNDSTIFDHFSNSKKIFWLHNPLQIEKSIRKNQLFSLLRNRPKVVFVSSYLESITSKLFFFSERLIISNFVSNDFINKKINFNRKQIFVWSVQRNKGLKDTLNIWINKISPFYKKAELHIFGSDELEKNFDKKKLRFKKIFFKGRVKRKILKDTYNKSLAMICLGYDETFCLNALEGNSCGLPIITFGKTALGDYVINNKNGFIINNYNDLSSAIIKMIQINKIKHKKLIRNSVVLSKDYLLNKIINNWLKILK